ncbi:MAG: tyrosine-type recombinase/integrase [bacterium]|nr:tyrosine-type recombinase/integrase [bacterium]
MAIIDKTPKSRDDKGIDFVEYVNEILGNEKERNKIGQSVYKNGLSGMKMFGEFLLTEKLGTYAPDKIYVSEISISIVEKYINWRKTVKKNTDETINHSLTPILKACKKAAIEGYISHTLNNSIQCMRIVTTKSLENDSGDKIRHLSTEEMIRLTEWYENDHEPRRREYVEMFMFAIYACGLRLIDMMTLRWVDIDFKKQVIRKVQVKTRNRNVIPIREAAIEILDRCKGLYKVFVFGMLSDKFDLNADEELRKRRNSVTATINTSLKRQSKFANLDKEITFHWTRHTWTVLALEKGVEISKISRLLDHTSTAVTEKVYAEFLPDTLGEVVDGLDFKF